MTYVGLRNRLAILSEAYAYAPYKDRVLATRDFVRECLIAGGRPQGQDPRPARRRRARRGQAGEPTRARTIACRSAREPRPLAGTEPILGYEEREEDGRRVRTEKPTDYPAQLIHDFAATETVARPFAYLLPPGFERSRGDAPAPRPRGPGAARGRRAGRGASTRSRRPASGRPAAGIARRRVELQRDSAPGVAAGPGRHARGPDGPAAGQPGGLPARAAVGGRPGDLEAASRTSRPGSDFPVLRLPRAVPLTTTAAADPLAEERKHDLPITFDLARGRGGACSRARTVVPSWLDGEHWLQVRDGRLYKVEAATGRSEPFLDPELLVRRA